ncbi:TRANK1 [Symbiodinium pilosum]|uniref:TRANK1 protein n=1 Tax=Symbiodinium pilosum TaxID=2952 RepID=A0A812X668_SYMPI|nr:TRANK1 [Symbiodinium pilosum]
MSERLSEPMARDQELRSPREPDDGDTRETRPVEPSESRMVVQIAARYVSAAYLQDQRMFADILDAKSSMEIERFHVRGWLLSGREVAEFELPATSTLTHLQAQFDSTLSCQCHLILSSSNGAQDLSAMPSSISLRSALAGSVQAWTQERAWHGAASEILAAQFRRTTWRGGSSLQALRIPRVWEMVMAMISIHERSEAQYAFRLTVERFLEHETFCSSAHQKSQHAGAHHMRCKAMYSDEVRQDGENSVRQLVKILQQPEPVDESLMQDITALAPAVLSLGLKATAPQLEQASHHFCNELIPKQNLPAELHWKAARLFESVGETGEAAQDLERSANTTFDFLALWRDAADLLGNEARAALVKLEMEARQRARRAGLCWVHTASESSVPGSGAVLNRSCMMAAERQFFNAGCVASADLCTAVIWSPREMFQMLGLVFDL